MRIAVISDIHSNYDALIKVLCDISKFKVDKIISLGDNIGYGPEPNETVELLIDNNIRSVLGNHELAILNNRHLSKFNKIARFSLIKTIKQIDKKTMDYIKGCDPYISDYGAHFVHGMPPESQTAYMSRTTPSDLKQMFRRIFSRICFNGHTHFLKYAEIKGSEVNFENLNEGLFSLNSENRYLINAGSVGQPRDGEKSAKYLIFDNSSYKIVVRYVRYNRNFLIYKMIKNGYPEEHTIRYK